MEGRPRLGPVASGNSLRSPVLRVLALLAVLSTVAGCASEPAPAVDRAALRADWERWAADRDSLFRSPASPLLPDSLAAFEGLPYFPYDSTLAVAAALVPSTTRDTVIFPTTTGDLQRYVSAGHLVFEAEGVQRRLEAFEPVVGEPRLFVPFYDATNRRETYGGGRYLDVPIQPTTDGRIPLDLNRAYHPYCVYNPSYSCPLPPPENRLEVAVTAGERLP